MRRTFLAAAVLTAAGLGVPFATAGTAGFDPDTFQAELASDVAVQRSIAEGLAGAAQYDALLEAKPYAVDAASPDTGIVMGDFTAGVGGYDEGVTPTVNSFGPDGDGGSTTWRVFHQSHSQINRKTQGFGWSSGAWQVLAGEKTIVLKSKVCPANGYDTGQYYLRIAETANGDRRHGKSINYPCKVPSTGVRTQTTYLSISKLGLKPGRNYYLIMNFMPKCGPHEDWADPGSQEILTSMNDSPPSTSDRDCTYWNYQFAMKAH